MEYEVRNTYTTVGLYNVVFALQKPNFSGGKSLCSNSDSNLHQNTITGLEE